MPLLGELGRTSWDSLESESDVNESWDDRRNSAKHGVFVLSIFLEDRFDRIDIRFDSIDTASKRRCGPPWYSCNLVTVSASVRGNRSSVRNAPF